MNLLRKKSNIFAGNDSFFIILILALLIFMVFQNWGKETTPDDEDYAQYILHAKALLAGKNYTETGYIYNDYNVNVGPKAYPPGLPFFLAIYYSIFHDDFSAKPLMLTFSFLWLIAIILYFYEIDKWLAYSTIIFMVGAIWFAKFSLCINSDIVFASLIWLIILIIDKNKKLNNYKYFLLFIIGFFAILTRTIGVVLIPAFIIFWVIKYRKVKIKPLIIVSLWTATFFIANFLIPIFGSYSDQYTIDFFSIIKIAFKNLLQYKLGVFEAILYPFQQDLLNDAYHLFAIPLIFIGILVLFIKKYKKMLLVFAIIYLLSLLVYPLALNRLFFPLYPIIIFSFLLGIRKLIGNIFSIQNYFISSKITFLIAALIVFASILNTKSSPSNRSFITNPDVQDIFHWIKTNTEKDDRIVFVKPRILAWQTGVSAMPTFSAKEHEMLDYLYRKQITHIIIGDLGLRPVAEKATVILINKYPDKFRKLYENNSFKIYNIF